MLARLATFVVLGALLSGCSLLFDFDHVEGASATDAGSFASEAGTTPVCATPGNLFCDDFNDAAKLSRWELVTDKGQGSVRIDSDLAWSAPSSMRVELGAGDAVQADCLARRDVPVSPSFELSFQVYVDRTEGAAALAVLTLAGATFRLSPAGVLSFEGKAVARGIGFAPGTWTPVRVRLDQAATPLPRGELTIGTGAPVPFELPSPVSAAVMRLALGVNSAPRIQGAGWLLRYDDVLIVPR